MTEDKALVEHSRSDLAYIMGLSAHMERGKPSDKNISDLIAMVRWNAEQHIYAKDRLEQLTAEVERLIEACAEPAFEVGVLREALDWMADSEPLVVEAILNRVRAALEGKQ